MTKDRLVPLQYRYW